VAYCNEPRFAVETELVAALRPALVELAVAEQHADWSNLQPLALVVLRVQSAVGRILACCRIDDAQESIASANGKRP